MKKVQIIILIAALLCFIGSAAYLGKYFWDRHVSAENMNSVRELLTDDEDSDEAEDEDDQMPTPKPAAKTPEGILKKYSKLHDANPDFVGWVTVDGTRIDYPVMYVEGDNDTYLHHNFDKAYDDNGVPFIDGGCHLNPDSDILILYGHHMNDNSMFASMTDYKDKKFYDKHPYIKFDTIWQEGTWEITNVILARALYDNEDGFRYYGIIDFTDKAQFDDYMKNINSLSLYDTGKAPEYGDQMIILSTCEYSQDNGRMALIAKRIR